MSDLQDRFLRLREKVLVKRPILEEILKKKGDKSLYDYSSDYIDVNLNPPILHRQSELLTTIHEAATERFGVEVADGVVAQLEKYYFVSTADHVGPIVHPFFLNSNLMIELPFHTHNDPVLKYVVVLACANVSVNNPHSRALIFNTAQGEELKQHRLSFLPSNSHSCSVYNMRAYMPEEVTKVRKRLHEMGRDEGVPKGTEERIESLIDEIYNTSDILTAPSYREQMSKTNIRLWKKFFAASKVKRPELVYLEQEDIVVRLITKYHLHQDTVINHILFDPKYEPYINNYFEGIFGSFSRAHASGTYLFWALPKGSKCNLQLWRKGNYLVSKDETYKIELTPEAIGEAMRNRELIPSLLLNFITISFYYGLKCLGGFNQVNYLTLMKNAYIKMNVDLGNYRSIEVCSRAQTKEICDGMSLAFLGYDGGRSALAYGLDLILYDRPDSWDKIVSLSKHMTLGEAIDPLMPEIYKISYDQTEWEQDLVDLTEKDIMHMKGLDAKIEPCVEIREG